MSEIKFYLCCSVGSVPSDLPTAQHISFQTLDKIHIKRRGENPQTKMFKLNL